MGIDVATTMDRGLLKRAFVANKNDALTAAAPSVNESDALELTDRAPAVPTRREIRSELINSLYEQAVPILMIDMAIILGITLLFIRIEAPRPLHLPWTVSLIMVALARFMLARRYLERRHAQSEVPWMTP